MSKGIDDNISYATATWSPAVGCSHLSPGCDHCLAARQASRGLHAPGRPSPWLDDEGQPLAARGRWTGQVRCYPERLKIPLHWKKPRRVLVPIMGDLFHPEVPFEFIDEVFEVMAATQRHTYLVLTKRPGRMLEWYRTVRSRRPIPGHGVCTGESPFCIGDRCPGHDASVGYCGSPWPLPNVLLGTSVEDQERADERLPLLLQCPAVGHWASLEPLLGPVRFDHIGNALFDRRAAIRRAMNGPAMLNRDQAESCIAYPELSFIALGAETGPGARPMDLNWARQVRDDCIKAGVSFFYKRGSDGSRFLDGRKWERFPEVAA